MDSFEFNKMAGALLGALVLTMGVGFIADIVFFHPLPSKPGYDLPLPAPSASSTAPAAPVEPLPVLLAKASAQKGESDAKACETCHNFEKGAGPKIGPPLYGVVGRKVASVAGFDYSDALKGKGGDWTFDKLFDWIKDPAAYAPGTKMAFAGEDDPARRADILVYLRSLSDSPVPLPPPPAAKPAPAAPAAAGSAPAAAGSGASAPAAGAKAPAAGGKAPAAPSADAPSTAAPAAPAAPSPAQSAPMQSSPAPATPQQSPAAAPSPSNPAPSSDSVK